MGNFLVLAAAGATILSAYHTKLSTEEALSLGVEVVAHNLEYELIPAPSPIFLQVHLDQFQDCEVRDVDLDVKNSSGNVLFGTTISEFNGIYPFRLDREFIAFTDVAIACDLGPDRLPHVYIFNLGELVQEY